VLAPWLVQQQPLLLVSCKHLALPGHQRHAAMPSGQPVATAACGATAIERLGPPLRTVLCHSIHAALWLQTVADKRKGTFHLHISCYLLWQCAGWSRGLCQVHGSGLLLQLLAGQSHSGMRALQCPDYIRQCHPEAPAGAHIVPDSNRLHGLGPCPCMVW
jgi:hypothetical protein